MAVVRIAGLDGSLRNFGVAIMDLDTETLALSVVDLLLFKTDTSKIKQVRASSDNYNRAKFISDGANDALAKYGCVTAFGEVPAGGQDYKSVLGFGIVIGIYASLRTAFSEVSPSETKMAAVGTRTASKEEMIEWAMTRFPTAPWRTRKFKGAVVPTADNEHLADAVAIAHAGLLTPSFKQTVAILNANSRAA